MASTVLTQVTLALGSAFRDEISFEDQKVHKVLVVSSGEITKEATESLSSALKGMGQDNRVRTLGGDRLWNLVNERLPRQLIYGSLVEAHRALAAADPEHSYLIQCGPKEVHVILLPESTDRPLPLRFDPQFPETPDGKSQLERFKKFLATGEAVEVDAGFLKIEGLPGPASMLLDHHGGRIKLGPSLMSAPLLGRLLLRQGSDDVELMPLIEFGANTAGSDQARLSNAQQRTPFKFTIPFPGRGGRSVQF